MLVSDQEGTLACLNGLQEVIARLQLRSCLSTRVNRGIDGTLQGAFYRYKTLQQIVERDLPDHHQIDIALRSLLPAREGAIDKSEFNFLRERSKRLGKLVKDAGSLNEQGL